MSNNYGSPRTTTMNEFRVEGQALKKTGGSSDTTIEASPDPESRPIPECKEDDERPGTENVYIEQLPLICKLMDLNTNLEAQIETLRLRLEFDTKHHEDDKKAAVEQTTAELKTKDSELQSLKTKLKDKEQVVHSLSMENQDKCNRISALQNQISGMKKDIDITRKYGNDLQKEYGSLLSENGRLEKGLAYDDKDAHIKTLTKEIGEMGHNLTRLECELEKAREIISGQGGKIRLLENEKKNMHVKFKEELSRVSLTLKLEIEKMRDVMKGQWDEMKTLRTQNEEMGRDIKEIKEMLLTSHLDTNRSQASMSPVFGHAFKPTLPSLTKDTKRILTGRKK